MAIPIPVARQREVVCLPATGHQVVLGTAGSGKTTMAIRRSVFLSDPEMPTGGRTLLLTFNKALAAYIKSVADGELVGVDVDNYHHFARGYLEHRGQMGWNAIASAGARLGLIRKAVAGVAEEYQPNPFFRRPIGFFEAEISWLARHGVVSSEDYEAQNRVGRAEARLERALRPVMWKVYRKYLEERGARGFKYDWDDVASTVSSQFASDHTDRRYKHIVIDEGQDLSPEMLKSLTAAIPADGSITFFGDVAQQIYGHRMSWRSAGLSPIKVWKFSENYRNTAEIAALGLAIAAMPYYQGVPDMVAPTAWPAAGPKPTLVHVADPTKEIALVSEQASRLARTQSVAILARNVRQVNSLRAKAPPGAVNLREDAGSWAEGPGIFVGTYHSAKGLEFDAVIMPFLSSANLPDPYFIDDHGPDEAAANDGRLLYVGVTRAKKSLILTYFGQVTSLLPSDPGLYTKVAG